jgi:tetratricopeptide (TPR) repeat protein
LHADKPHYKIGIYGHNRADIERKRGNYAKALEMYQEALGMIRLTLGATHSEAADPLHATGLVYHQLGNYEKALEHVSAALQIVEREVDAR